MKRVVFFNGHQNGDIANSRGVIKYITNKLGSDYEYYYLILRTEFGSKGAVNFDKNIKIHNPMTQGILDFFPPGWNLDIKTAHERGENFFIYKDSIFLNVWIGSSEYFIENRMPYGGGITRKSIHEQTCELIDLIEHSMNVKIEYPNEFETLPIATEEPDNKNKTDDLIKLIQSKHNKIVLICNNPVMSNQTHQFNFGEILKETIIDSNVAFVFTCKNFEPYSDNVYFIDDFLPTPNLSEIDYFSRECSIIVSRMSGAGIITMNNKNYFDKTKTLISFTVSPQIAFEALQTDNEIENQSWGNESTAKMVWSNNITPENINKIIKDYL